MGRSIMSKHHSTAAAMELARSVRIISVKNLINATAASELLLLLLSPALSLFSRAPER